MVFAAGQIFPLGLEYESTPEYSEYYFRPLFSLLLSIGLLGVEDKKRLQESIDSSDEFVLRGVHCITKSYY